MMEAHRSQVRVRYADTDAMGVAYNSVYLVWFEVGRTEWLRDRALSYREVESRGVSLPLIEATLRIRSGARYDEVLEVETCLREVRSRRIVFGYRILAGDRCLAEGMTVHVPVESATGRSIRLPDWLVPLLRNGPGGRK
jgi:acyl-CoA thioester hydrolase